MTAAADWQAIAAALPISTPDPTTFHDARSFAAALATDQTTLRDELDEPTTAATLPVLPARHFAQDDPPPGTPLQITDDGRVWGLVAPSGVCHRGLPGCVTVESLEAGGPIDWQGGQTSAPIKLDDGSQIRTLALTMRGGHPDVSMTAAEARAHHDDTATVVADVIAWRSPVGVAVSGALRRDLDENDLREMLGAAPSIEIWPTETGRVLLGIQLVPTPAWPVAAAVDGDVAILESGRVEQTPCDCHDDEPTIDELVDRLTQLERFAVATLASIERDERIAVASLSRIEAI